MPGCLNCGATLSGPFCAHCGQRDVPPHPTVRELACDAYGELVGWDGRLARTIALLVRSPGTLTREILDGRRAAFISPVRLYLSCSLVYFLVSAWVPALDMARTFDVGVGVDTGASLTPRSPSDVAVAQAMSRGLPNLDPAQRQLVETAIAGQPAFVRSILRAMVTDPQGVRQRAADTMPRVLFAMIPALAGVLAFFYRGRHFPEHLYFAVLFQAFVFLVLTVQSLTAFAGTIVALAVGQVAAGIVIAGCGVVAQRQVYGGSWVAAVLKGLGVGAIYLMLWSAVVLGVTLWASG
jgi:hypothetical protein